MHQLQLIKLLPVLNLYNNATSWTFQLIWRKFNISDELGGKAHTDHLIVIEFKKLKFGKMTDLLSENRLQVGKAATLLHEIMAS